VTHFSETHSFSIYNSRTFSKFTQWNFRTLSPSLKKILLIQLTHFLLPFQGPLIQSPFFFILYSLPGVQCTEKHSCAPLVRVPLGVHSLNMCSQKQWAERGRGHFPTFRIHGTGQSLPCSQSHHFKSSKMALGM
jgi:hypothetical protein